MRSFYTCDVRLPMTTPHEPRRFVCGLVDWFISLELLEAHRHPGLGSCLSVEHGSLECELWSFDCANHLVHLECSAWSVASALLSFLQTQRPHTLVKLSEVGKCPINCFGKICIVICGLGTTGASWVGVMVISCFLSEAAKKVLTAHSFHAVYTT